MASESDLRPSRPLPREGATRLRVRYCECDPFGVDHHASYVAWLEIARTEMLREGGVTYGQMEAAGVFLVIAGLEIKYRRPGRYDDLLDVHCRVTGGSKVKLEHEYEVRLVERVAADVERLREAGEDVLIVAKTTLVCVGADVKVRGLPEWMVAREQ